MLAIPDTTHVPQWLGCEEDPTDLPAELSVQSASGLAGETTESIPVPPRRTDLNIISPGGLEALPMRAVVSEFL
jgi:hypothetical protein